MSETSPAILLTGATGYGGGRLLPLLEARGDRIRCLARQPQSLGEVADLAAEVDQGDLLDSNSLRANSRRAALDGVKSAYYLVHSMGSRSSFENQDRMAARIFAEAAREAGVQQLTYLGGLGDDDDRLSTDLRSRHEVGQILLESGSVVFEFRASILIGSGSLSFELVRALVQRLPVMICPKWVSVQTQPIAIEDLLAHLVAALDWRRS